MRRIVIVGCSGVGKSTLARRLSARLGVPHVELDALHWEPGWVAADPAVFRERVRQAVVAPAWVADGNYGAVRDLVWGGADTVLWLDFSFLRVFRQALVRTLRRAVRREVLWNGNRESLWDAFFRRESILWWVITTFRKRRREQPQLLARPEYRHLALLHFQGPRAVETWLKSLD